MEAGRLLARNQERREVTCLLLGKGALRELGEVSGEVRWVTDEVMEM